MPAITVENPLVEQARASAFAIVDDDPHLAQHPLIADELDLIFSDRDEEFLSKG